MSSDMSPAGSARGTDPATGMTRLPDCELCGQIRWVQAMCGCGHPYVVHDLNTKQVRTRCLTQTVAGYCPCAKFEEVPHG